MDLKLIMSEGDGSQNHRRSEIQIFKDTTSIRKWRRNELLQNRTIGFVPTMGALHEGHLSLIRAAAHDHSTIVVSIFVNPAQFGPTEDLDKYPRTLEADMEKLNALNGALGKEEHRDGSARRLGTVKAVFNPTLEVLYPSGIPLDPALQRGAFVHVTPISSVLEGVTRPQFFRGVATVVTKLFNIITPEAAYFGQKDVQQSIIIKKLVKDLCFDIQIVIGPTIRDATDGLAMSSRNVYLGPERRSYANCLWDALQVAERVYLQGLEEGTVVRKKDMFEAAVNHLTPFHFEGKAQVEYISLADGEDLTEFEDQEVIDREKGRGAVLSGAIRVSPRHASQGVVRLIDNIILR